MEITYIVCDWCRKKITEEKNFIKVNGYKINNCTFSGYGHDFCCPDHLAKWFEKEKKESDLIIENRTE